MKRKKINYEHKYYVTTWARFAFMGILMYRYISRIWTGWTLFWRRLDSGRSLSDGLLAMNEVDEGLLSIYVLQLANGAV